MGSVWAGKHNIAHWGAGVAAAFCEATTKQ